MKPGRRLFLFSPFLLGLGSRGAAGPSKQQPRVFLLDREHLIRTREILKQGHIALQPALARLKRDAEQALELKPASVMDKKLAAASGDKHDYFSYGPYWWPDPNKPDGLPYIRRDGEVNPESDTGTDDLAFSRLCGTVETLGLAYWFTGDERFAAKATQFVRVWFLDGTTRMNPNFQHAQAIPGISPGRGIGLIESRRLIALNEGLALISDSAAWTAADRSALKVWLTDFYRWLTSSSHGRDEAKAENNHGTWYDVQTAHLALVLGRDADAKTLLKEGLTRRLAAHVEPDGSQPHELARTRSLSYSLFNLEALFACASLGAHVGIDWWGFNSKDSRSLHAALSYVAPYVDPVKAWPRKDVESADRSRLLPLLAHFLQKRDDPHLRALFVKHSPDAQANARWRLFYPGTSLPGGTP